eukprot:SAG11_NODE_7540_length_1131_cov_19.357558_2_plen_46_part_00
MVTAVVRVLTQPRVLCQPITNVIADETTMGWNILLGLCVGCRQCM